MYVVAAAQFTAAGTADILVNQYIPRWGCPVTLISDNGMQFSWKLSVALYECLGINKINSSSYHPFTNGCIERVNHTVALMISMGFNEQQDNWDALLSHIEAAYNDSVKASTGITPNEVHMGRLPRLPLSVFDPPNRWTLEPRPRHPSLL